MNVANGLDQTLLRLQYRAHRLTLLVNQHQRHHRLQYQALDQLLFRALLVRVLRPANNLWLSKKNGLRLAVVSGSSFQMGSSDKLSVLMESGLVQLFHQRVSVNLFLTHRARVFLRLVRSAHLQVCLYLRVIALQYLLVPLLLLAHQFLLLLVIQYRTLRVHQSLLAYQLAILLLRAHRHLFHLVGALAHQAQYQAHLLRVDSSIGRQTFVCRTKQLIKCNGHIQKNSSA